jgi:quercetin dioxygenase-like cupin family protein
MTLKLKLATLLSACAIAYSQDKPNPNFTGGEVKTIKENSQANPAHFYFPPGVRTKWHSHEGGQIILVEDGVGLYQEKSGPVIELRAGETHYCPPGVVHWHGASPKEGGTQFNISRGGMTWLEVVSDEDFNAKPVHK